MTDNAPPSRNPADNDSMQGMFKTVLRKFLQRVDDMLPAQIMAYNRTTNRAQIQPMINVITTSNQQVPRAQIASVPVQQMGGGGFVMSFPFKTNDLGWLKSNDRDISLFNQFYKQSPPNTLRFHDFKDAVLLPDTMMQGVTIAEEDADNVVWQNLDGTVKISLWNNQIKIVAPNVIVDTPVMTITGIIAVQNVNGEPNPCTINGAINATGDIIAGSGSENVSLLNHVHGGVMTGGGETGGPVG